MKSAVLAPVLALAPSALATSYNLATSYAGSNFFDGWSWYGSFDNLTNGDVTFVDQATAMSSSNKLAYVDSNGHAIIKVDNTSDVIYNYKRNSVRIESTDAYPVGSVWVIDINHLPYGCSVWPAFWTAGTNWPANGEIDIIEQVNLATNNQMALHTSAGCTKASGGTQSGTNGAADCGTSAGCTVSDASDKSFGSGFASAGGGVWATQFDSSGINIWFWSRADVPSSISASASSVDPSTWGTPSAAYSSSSCDINTYFGPQRLILDITLCGDWAGAGAVYNASSCYSTANGKQGLCYVDNVINAGSPTYDDAYFDISYLRAYTLPNVTVTSNATTSASASGASATASGKSGSSSSTSGAMTLPRGAWAAVAAVVLGSAAALF